MSAAPARPDRAQCCIVGGGPAGIMAGYLLARAGVSVIVLERHADFLRDFRGDTVHPSTLETLAELGLLEAFLRRPHRRLDQFSVRIGSSFYRVADMRRLPVHAPFVAMTPQWEFLDFLARAGGGLSGFDLRMATEATALVQAGERIIGVTVVGPSGPSTILADLVIAADGRRSLLRDQAGLLVRKLGAPIDVLWFRLPRGPDDADAALLNLTAGGMMVMIDRGDYFQCGLAAPKGDYDAIRAAGLPALRAQIRAIEPRLGERVEALADWDQIRLLSVTVDRLRKWWRPGLLCIGDAAHAMSPIGGVGVNLAIQDAVAAANRLAMPLSQGRLSDADLAAVEVRRAAPVRWMQTLQVLAQTHVLLPALRAKRPLRAPALIRLLDRWPWLRRLPALVIGLGFRPEHVLSPAIVGAGRPTP